MADKERLGRSERLEKDPLCLCGHKRSKHQIMPYDPPRVRAGRRVLGYMTSLAEPCRKFGCRCQEFGVPWVEVGPVRAADAPRGTEEGVWLTLDGVREGRGSLLGWLEGRFRGGKILGAAVGTLPANLDPRAAGWKDAMAWADAVLTWLEATVRAFPPSPEEQFVGTVLVTESVYPALPPGLSVTFVCAHRAADLPRPTPTPVEQLAGIQGRMVGLVLDLRALADGPVGKLAICYHLNRATKALEEGQTEIERMTAEFAAAARITRLAEGQEGGGA